MVMQHVTKAKIDLFISELKNVATPVQPAPADPARQADGAWKVMNHGQAEIHTADSMFSTAGISVK